MKHLFTSVSILFGSFFLMTSCLKDECSHTKSFVEYQPVYIDQQTFDAPARFIAEKEVRNTGIVYSYGRYVLINEFQKGIHVIDNENPDQLKPVGFIDIPGNTHFTIRNHILYANKMEDLVAIDVSDMEQPEQVSRLQGIFPNNRSRMTENGILAYYEKTTDHITVDCNDYRYSTLMFSNNDRLYFESQAGANTSNDMAYAKSSGGNSSPVTMGVGGSMARFTTVGDQLYLLSNHQLEVVDIAQGNNPQWQGKVPVQFNAETLYPFQDYLYIGTSSGMHIYSVAQGDLPQHVSTVAHIRSCDPVITDGEYAYVTLRGGTACGGFTNQLESYDVQNVFQPRLVHQYPMLEPHGLTKIGNEVYVCEGIHGWKKIDVSQSNDFKTTYFNQDHHAFDVIHTPQNTLLIIGEDGLYQYDVSGDKPVLVSNLTIHAT